MIVDDSDSDDVCALNGELATWVQDEFESEDDGDVVHDREEDGESEGDEKSEEEHNGDGP